MSLFKKVKCSYCAWSEFNSGNPVGMTPCHNCDNTGYIYEEIHLPDMSDEEILFLTCMTRHKYADIAGDYIEAQRAKMRDEAIEFAQAIIQAYKAKLGE